MAAFCAISVLAFKVAAMAAELASDFSARIFSMSGVTAATRFRSSWMFPTAAGSTSSLASFCAAVAMLEGSALFFSLCSKIRTLDSSSANFRSK